MNSNRKYDVIIIGSGIGGLALAAILAKMNRKKVLILERHFKMGGLTHEFERKGKFTWDVGLHYVGEMAEGELTRKIFDYLTDGKIKWNRMPSPFDIFIYPQLTFAVPDDENKYKTDLIKLFPEEKKAIRQYFIDIKKINSWLRRSYVKKISPPPVNWMISFLNYFAEAKALMTTADYLNKNFKDSKLKAVLASQWGDYGLPPSQSAFATHCFIVYHYLKGGYYPEGGSQKIAQSIVPMIEAEGGRVLLNREATQIIVKNNQAIGVEVNVRSGKEIQKETFYAPIIVSGIGALNTYLELLPDPVAASFKEYLDPNCKFCSAVTVYIGFKEDPRKLGFKGENYWIFADYDHDKIIKQDILCKNYNAGFCYLSFPSLKNPSAKFHTAEIICLTTYDFFQKWKGQPWLKKEQDYHQLKERIAEALIDLVEKHFKGFRALIEYKEISTPLTLEHFTGRMKGSMYGLPATPGHYKSKWANVKTPIKNLYLTGSDVFFLGIVGAMMGGVATASVINGPLGFFKIFQAAKILSTKNK